MRDLKMDDRGDIAATDNADMDAVSGNDAILQYVKYAIADGDYTYIFGEPLTRENMAGLQAMLLSKMPKVAHSVKMRLVPVGPGKIALFVGVAQGEGSFAAEITSEGVTFVS